MHLNWLAHAYIPEDGYGRYAIHLIRALVNQGVEVAPGVMEITDMPGWMLRRALNTEHITLQCMPAHMMKALPGRVWGLTMTEDTSCPDEWVHQINTVCERLIVPCEQNSEAFKDRGVTVPIHVVYGGTCPQEFPVLPEVCRNRPYTFLALADRGNRKGVHEAYTAFYRAFEGLSDVRFVIKIREGSSAWVKNSVYSDTRLNVWREDVNSMADVYSQIDCFVFPTYGEGWGMPPREAAMMGLPVIATDWSGTAVGCEQWAIPLRKFTMQQSQIYKGGKWAFPDIDEVAEKMRWVYENKEAARVKGLCAANWLRANQTWNDSARLLIALLESHG